MYLCEKCLVTGDLHYDYHLRDHMATEYTEANPPDCSVCDSKKIWIDDIIAPIITTLWRKRIMTLGCCGGHSAVANPLKGMYHKLYVIFDLKNISFDIFYHLREFCIANPEAFIRYEPYNGMGLYLPSETYTQHLNNISALLTFCERLPINRIPDNPNEITATRITKCLNYRKFFYDIVVYDEHNERQLLSFNFYGIYQFNICKEKALYPFSVYTKTTNPTLIQQVEELIEDYPIDELITNPNYCKRNYIDDVIKRLKKFASDAEIPERVFEK